jgi:peptidoglycan hydrolase-like protein with peptidoglycan-binding domain
MNRIIILVFALWMPVLHAADLGKGTQAFDNGNYNNARYELEPLAKAGDSKAQVLIGVMHATGNGYQQDYVQAHKWLTLSARAGNDEAQQASQRIAARMTHAQLRDARSQAERFRPTPLAQGNASSSWAQAPQSLPSGRALVAEVQAGLTRLGYDPGSADGLMGRRTVSAISGFQRQIGLHADGKATQSVLLAIRKAESEGLRATAPTATARTNAIAIPGASNWYFAEQSLDAMVKSLRRLLGNNDNNALRRGVTSLVQRGDWPWTERVFRDDFSNRAGQGGLDWQVARGEFAIRDGLLSDARSATEPAPPSTRDRSGDRSGKRSGKEEVLGILGALLGAQIEQQQSARKSAPTRAPAQRRTVPDEVRLAAASRGSFLLRVRLLAQDPTAGTEFVLQRTVQGAAEELRLRYNASTRQLLIEQSSSRGVRQIAATALRLDAGRHYNIEWARMRGGLMQVALNGQLIIRDASIKLRGGFDTFAWRNHGGSYLLSEVEMHTRRR